MSAGFAAGFARTGIAHGGFESAFVNGWPYAQVGRPDPSTFDSLELAAQDFLGNRRWVERLDDWEVRFRPERLAVARALTAVRVAALDDHALIAHLEDALTARRDSSYRHFEQHSLCVLIGELIVACREWGIEDAAVLPLLEGASPASARTAEHLQRIADALREAGVVPQTLDDIRAASETADRALAEYLDLCGFQIVGGFDLDCRSLIEMPHVVVASVVSALNAGPEASATTNATSVRDEVPAPDRERFDSLLADARMVYGLRDDDVFFTLWGSGLVRRALLEIGARLVGRHVLEEPDHVLEMTLAEIGSALAGGDAPPVADVAARVARRNERAGLRPPPQIGEGRPPQPPFDEMPPTVRRLTRAMGAYMQLRRARPSEEPLVGIGVGETPYRGRAIVAVNADDAFDRLQPGDVLVTPLTTPSFNAVLTLCGALVVEDAGILSHAAVTARELGLPAVLGVARATQDIPDGAQIEVDPVGGRVSLLTVTV